MKKIIILIIWSVAILSCTSDFEEMNKNPMTSVEEPTSALLTQAMQDLIGVNSSLGYNKTLMLYSQQWAQRETTTTSLYQKDSYDGDWKAWYTNGLPELVEIIKLNSGESKGSYAAYGKNENQIATAMILKAWAFHNITDTWGNVPYSQAFDFDYSQPKYDKQEEIYPKLLAELKNAVNMMDTSVSGFKSGDLMYNGNMNKWMAFANSLRARIAMRMSEVNPSLAQTEVSSALNATIFASNTDNAQISFQNAEAQANPLYLEFLTQSWTFVSEPMIDLMNSYGSGTAAAPSDPRVMQYAAQNSANEYQGFPYGLDSSTSLTYAINARSLPNDLVRTMDFPSYIMTYAELLFIKAEAEQRGWFGAVGDASTTYKDAIVASMNQWNVASADIATYTGLADVQYNATNWRKMIGDQKYIALYMQGSSAWSEWRRLDFPVITAPALTAIPRRFFYSLREGIVNFDNVEQAKIDMGGDLLSTTMWWDQ